MTQQQKYRLVLLLFPVVLPLGLWSIAEMWDEVFERLANLALRVKETPTWGRVLVGLLLAGIAYQIGTMHRKTKE